MENPMQKMFSGHKYSKDDIESNFINIDADISLEELEEFYKKVRDTQIHGLHELALKHHRESTKNIAEVLRILNESDNKEVVDAVNKILTSFKKNLIESLNVNNNMQKHQIKRLDMMEKTIFILSLVVFISLIPNIIIILKYIFSLISIYL